VGKADRKADRKEIERRRGEGGREREKQQDLLSLCACKSTTAGGIMNLKSAIE
jgi:hypothetical protein